MAEPETKKVKVAPAAEEGGGSSGCVKKAIITGITGQDGSYLAEFLLEKVRCCCRCVLVFGGVAGGGDGGGDGWGWRSCSWWWWCWCCCVLLFFCDFSLAHW